jgi:ABC-type branched-subunit amino acid transport system permease subunit
VRIGWNGAGLAAIAVGGLALAFGLPQLVETYVLVDLTAYAVMAILALSLALVWGFAGILNFGQTTFFGLGGYAYTIAAMNMGDSTVPVLIGIAVPVAFAAALGYFLFYGRVSDIYLGTITLCISLIFFNLINSSGAEYRIGVAPLGGNNGLPGVPPLNVPGDPARPLDFEEMYQLSVVVLLLVYFGLRALLASRFGHVVVAIRENELRAELLGYDARLYKLIVFAIGAGLAGLSGILYACWGSFIGPNVFSILLTAQVIIWILVGGLGTLVGAAGGAVAIQWLTTWLGTTKIADANIILGIIFIVFVLLVPRGVQPKLLEWLRPLAARRG